MTTLGNTTIIEAVRELYTAMGRFDRRAAQLLGIHVTDLHCIDLVQKAPLSARDIASALGLTPSAVTTILDRLESGSFVERRSSSTDRRKIEVHLTSLGRRRASKAYRELGRRVGALEGDLSTAKKRATLRALLGLSQACNEATDAVADLSRS